MIAPIVLAAMMIFVPSFCSPTGNYWQDRKDNFQSFRKDTVQLPVLQQPLKVFANRGNYSHKVGVILTENKRYDTTIVFPDSEEDELEIIPKIDVEPKCAAGSTFCEDIDSYPRSHVKQILSADKKHTDLFGVDESPVENRIGDDIDRFICGSIEMTIFPQVAKNKDKKWKYIVNQGGEDKYVQGVRIEKCLRPNGPCNLLGTTAYGYYTSCKQKFIYRRLLSLSDVGRPVVDQFEIPSACCCAYKKDLGPFLNFRTPLSPHNKS